MSHKYLMVTKIRQISSLINYCKRTKYCSIDIETSGEPYYVEDSYITMLSISFQPGSSFCIPLGHSESKFKKNWLPLLKKIDKGILRDPTITKIAWNAKFEEEWFMKYGCIMKGRVFDAMLAKHLLDEERPNDLESQVKKFLPEYGDYKDDTELLARKNGWANIPIKDLADRNALDADLTLRLMLFFEKRLIRANLYKLFRNLTMQVHHVLAESEFHGFPIDAAYLNRITDEQKIKIDENEEKLRNHKVVKTFQRKIIRSRIRNLIKQTTEEINDLYDQGLDDSDRKIKARQDKITRYISGQFTTKKEKRIVEDFNFRSPQQLIQLMYESKFGFRFKVKKTTETGNPSTDEETLNLYRRKDKSGFIEALLNHREITTLYSTFMVGVQERLTEDNKIHASFHIHGTVTGRLSSTNPNLQNIPRGITSDLIKKMYIPPKGYLIYEIDYSQAELRIVAELADESVMIGWFNKGYNPHVATACKMMGVLDKYDEVKAILKDENHPDNLKWERLKKKAKLVNFGILYGQTEKKLAATPDDEGKPIFKTEKDAKQFLEDWKKGFPKITKWIANQHKFAKKHGYVTNMFGRKRRLPNINSPVFGKMLEAQRQSANSPIQGCSSDFTQFSSVLIREERLKGNLPSDFLQLYTVHDSIGYQIKPEDIHKVNPIVCNICVNPQTLKWFGFETKKVKMKVSPEIGINWFALSEYDAKMDYTKLLA